MINDLLKWSGYREQYSVEINYIKLDDSFLIIIDQKI